MDAERDDYICGVCMETYKGPKILPCLHTFCKECLSKIVKVDECNALSLLPESSSPQEQTLTSQVELDCAPAQISVSAPSGDDSWIIKSEPAICEDVGEEENVSTSTTITCPVCKETHNLSAGGVDGLQDNVHTLEKLEQMSIKQTLSAQQIQCILCDEDKVGEYCEKCSGFLCDFCVSTHKRQSRYSSHSTVPCDELSPEQYVSPNREVTCKQHNKEIVFRCNDCDSFLCPKCTISGNHQSHHFVTIEDSDKDLMDETRDLTYSSKQLLAKFQSHKDFMLRTERDIVCSSHYDMLKAETAHQFDEYIRCLQSKKQELLERVEAYSNSLKKQIWGEKEAVEHTIAAIESGIQFAEKVGSVHNPIERIKLNSQVISRLSKVTDKALLPSSSIMPPLVLRCAGSTESLSTIADLSALKDTDISLQICGDEKPKICQDALVMVKFAAPILSSPQMQILYGKAQQILDESVTCMYESDEKNCYNLEFVPRVSGKHFVEVSLAGVCVAKKDFDVSGRPRYGNKVQCGPDWPNRPIVSVNGTVSEIALQLYNRVPRVTVTWEDDNRTQCEYEWGKDGVFEVELLPSDHSVDCKTRVALHGLACD